MTSEPVFADSSFFFALAAERDFAHRSATRVFTRLLKAQRRVICSDYVIDEALTLCKSRANSLTALQLLERIESSPAIFTEWITAERFDGAKAMFRKHADHGYSFTDCTSFILMRELGISDALTTDRHFEEAGFHPLLPLR